MTRIISSLADVSGRYKALFVDLWGCVHDGVRALPDAVAALQTYRAGGGHCGSCHQFAQTPCRCARTACHFRRA